METGGTRDGFQTEMYIEAHSQQAFCGEDLEYPSDTPRMEFGISEI